MINVISIYKDGEEIATFYNVSAHVDHEEKIINLFVTNELNKTYYFKSIDTDGDRLRVFSRPAPVDDDPFGRDIDVEF